jgi:hypothetical protein
VLLDLGTNKQPSEPKHTKTHSGNFHALLPVLHRSDRCPAPVRPVDRAGQVGGYSSRTTRVPESLSDLYRAWNKNTSKTQPAWNENSTRSLATTPNRPRTDQQHHEPRTHESSSSPEANPTSGLYQSDRSRTPVKPVKPRQLGMNNTRGSTPPNPNHDLPNRSMDLCKTLGIVGTHHEEYIAMFWSTKTCQIKRNRRNPAKNSSNPRTPKTPKSSPLTHGFGRGIKGVSVSVLDRQTYQGGIRGSRLCGEDRDRETENSKVCARTRDTRFIQVRVAKVASPKSCLGDQVRRLALGVGLRSSAWLGT